MIHLGGQGVLALGLLLAASTVSDDAASHEATLRAAGYRTETPALLDFLRSRILSDAERSRILGLIDQLGSNVYSERRDATDRLVAVGRKAVPFLQAALKDSDLEIVRRARWCLQKMEDGPESEVLLAVARLLAARKASEALPALLGYLPYLEEETPEDEYLGVVAALAEADGKSAAELRAALRSRLPAQRRAAAWVLGRSAKPAERSLVVGLLTDPDASVRYRAAEALVWGKDRRGLAPLADLVESAPADLAAAAEGLLSVVAGEQTPLVSLGSTDEQHRACAQAWRKWLREVGATVDLTRLELDATVQGLRLVVANSGYGGNGAVWEFGSDHKERWQLRNVGGPFDARVLSASRVLLAEYNDRRVSERDRNNRIVWEYRPLHGPLEVQRLPGGNTVVATNYDLVEVDRGGKVVFSFRDAVGNIFSGQKLPSGNYLYGLYTGHVVEIDRTGKEVHRFAIERPRGLANLVVLPGNHYLMPCATTNRIVEMDRSGKVVREVPVSSPTSVAVLPGGHLLVGSHIHNTVREIDRKGILLWEQKAEGQVFRVRVR